MLPTVLTYLPMAVLMFFTPKLVRKFGKKEVSGIGIVIAAVANIAMFLLLFMGKGDATLYIFMVFCLISGIGLNFFVLQVWAMAADSIDEIEIKTGSRDDGTAYSFFMFFRKLGQVIAAVAVNGTLLAMNYYDSIAETGTPSFTDGQLKIMFILATVIPAVMFGVMAVILLIVYPLGKKKVAQLQIDKEEKLKAAAEAGEIEIDSTSEVVGDAQAEPVEEVPQEETTEEVQEEAVVEEETKDEE